MGEKQTLHGLASWLVSMDAPDSESRRTVTLEKIIRQAEDALEHDQTADERDQLRQQVEKLLDHIDGHREQGSPTATPQKFARDRALYSAADQVRKELGE